MSFPNTMYKPRDEVWYLRPSAVTHNDPCKRCKGGKKDAFGGPCSGCDGTGLKTYQTLTGPLEPVKGKVAGVVWTQEWIGYHVNDLLGDIVDGDDLYPTKEAAQEAANKTGSQ